MKKSQNYIETLGTYTWVHEILNGHSSTTILNVDLL